jgi:hypothetical protein
MKKFGTPIGAGPGSANENVGLAGVGMPLLVRGGGGVGGAAFLCFFLAFFLAAGCWRLLPACAVPGFSRVGFCPLRCPEAFEVGLDEVLLVVVVGVEEPADEDEDLDPEPEDDFGLGEVAVDVDVEVAVEVVGGGAVAVTVAAGVVAVVVGHDHVGPLTICAPGGSSEDTDVPAATFWNVSVWPPRIVTTTVQPSAEASGSAARPNTAAMEPMVTAAMVSFRLVNTVAYSSRGMPHVKSSRLRSQVGLIRTLLAAAELCNWEPSVWGMSVRVPASRDGRSRTHRQSLESARTGGHCSERRVV